MSRADPEGRSCVGFTGLSVFEATFCMLPSSSGGAKEGMTSVSLCCEVTWSAVQNYSGNTPVDTLQKQIVQPQQSSVPCSWSAHCVPCAAVQDLSGAYTNLEAHCYQVEAEVRRLKEQLAQAPAQAAAEQPGKLPGWVCRQRCLHSSPLHTLSQLHSGEQLDLSCLSHPDHDPCSFQEDPEWTSPPCESQSAARL